MARATRSSKSSKTPKTPKQNKDESTSEEKTAESKRGSLRLRGKSTNPTTSAAPAASESSPKTPVATRSGRKRLSVSIDDPEEPNIPSPQTVKGPKRRRTAANTPSPAPPQPPETPYTTPAAARKRRGAQKEASPDVKSPPPSSPAPKRAKISTPSTPGLFYHCSEKSRGVDVLSYSFYLVTASKPTQASTPKSTRPAAATKRRQRPETSESEENHSERKEDKKATSSHESKVSSHQRRGPKRSRKAPSPKSPSPALEVKKVSTPASQKKKPTPPSKTKEFGEGVATSSETKNGGKGVVEPNKSPSKKQTVKLKKREPIRPKTKRELEALQRKILFSRLDHDDLSDLASVSDCKCRYFFPFLLECLG